MKRKSVERKPYLSIFTLVFIALLLSGCKNNGVIIFDDCREIIEVEENSHNTWLKSYTCRTEKTDSGKIIEGVCARVEMSKSGEDCLKAYFYKQKPSGNCGENARLSYDDECYCDRFYITDTNGKCVLD